MVTSKRYLRGIRERYKLIYHLSEQCDTLRFSLGASAIRYDKDNVQTTSRDITSEIMVEIFDIQDHITKLMRANDTSRFYALQILAHMTDHTQREVLRLYYLEPLNGYPRTWDQVAAQVGRSTKYVIRRIHPDALASFDDARKFV